MVCHQCLIVKSLSTYLTFEGSRPLDSDFTVTSYKYLLISVRKLKNYFDNFLNICMLTYLFPPSLPAPTSCCVLLGLSPNLSEAGKFGIAPKKLVTA